jgi:hypothetical protein
MDTQDAIRMWCLNLVPLAWLFDMIPQDIDEAELSASQAGEAFDAILRLQNVSMTWVDSGRLKWTRVEVAAVRRIQLPPVIHADISNGRLHLRPEHLA